MHTAESTDRREEEHREIATVREPESVQSLERNSKEDAVTEVGEGRRKGPAGALEKEGDTVRAIIKTDADFAIAT